MERYPFFMGGRNDAVKMLIAKKATYKFNANPIKIPMVFLNRNGKRTFLQFVWTLERCRKKKKQNIPTICIEKDAE